MLGRQFLRSKDIFSTKMVMFPWVVFFFNWTCSERLPSQQQVKNMANLWYFFSYWRPIPGREFIPMPVLPCEGLVLPWWVTSKKHPVSEWVDLMFFHWCKINQSPGNHPRSKYIPTHLKGLLLQHNLTHNAPVQKKGGRQNKLFRVSEKDQTPNSNLHT